MTASTVSRRSGGALVGDFEPERWDDHLLLPTARTTGPNQPTYAAFGTSLYAWSFSAGNMIYSDAAQIPHSWDFSPIRQHVHFSSLNGGSGNMVWEEIYRTRPVNGAWSAEVTKTVTWTGALAAGEGAVADLWIGDGNAVADGGPSHLYKSRLRLVSATFTGNIFLDGWDIHIRKNRAGTTTEFV